jgi:rRNA maturation endonuclease Nob1
LNINPVHPVILYILLCFWPSLQYHRFKLVKLSTIQSVALEIQNELGVEIDNYKVEILQKESGSIDLSNDKKQRLSSTDVSLLNTCYKHRKQCIVVSDDLLLKNIASENNIKCYTTPEFAAFLLRKGKINKNQCITFLNNLKKIYIRTRDIDKVLKRIEGW